MSEFYGATPGPWIASGNRVYAISENPLDATTDDEPINIADCDMDTRIDYDTTGAANAALIAAAPTLLAQRDALAKALRELEAAGDRVYHDLEQRIRAASASAVPVFDGVADLHDAITHARAALALLETEK